MTGVVAAAVGHSKQPGSLDGTLDASGAGPTITSATRTWTIPAPSPRDYTFQNFTITGAGVGVDYQKNGGAWTACPDPTTVSFASSDTLTLRATGCTAGESAVLDLIDSYTGLTIETVNIIGV